MCTALNPSDFLVLGHSGPWISKTLVVPVYGVFFMRKKSFNNGKVPFASESLHFNVYMFRKIFPEERS